MVKNMKFLSKECGKNGEIEVICEESSILGLRKIKTSYRATKELPKGFWNWEKESASSKIDGLMLFRLDDYCSEGPCFKYLDDYILYQSFGCVLNNEISSCIFKKIRNITNMLERSKYVKTLSLDEKIEIYNHHKSCIKDRTLFKNLN